MNYHDDDFVELNLNIDTTEGGRQESSKRRLGDMSLEEVFNLSQLFPEYKTYYGLRLLGPVPNPSPQPQQGDRGLTTIRHMSQAQFETVYNNIVGFEEAYLCWSKHEAWGARDDHGNRVLEIFINLDKIANSYALDRNHPHPRLVINESFIERIKWIFYVFYDSEKQDEYTANSTLGKSFLDVAELPWRTPQVIVLYFHFTIDGAEKVFPIMENSRDWKPEEDDLNLPNPEYIEHCSQRYQAFLAGYAQYFDENGSAKG